MELKDEKTKKFIQDIFQGKGNDVVKTVLNEGINLPLDVIKIGIEHRKFGFNYSKNNKIYEIRKQEGQLHNIDQGWVQTLAYSKDLGVEDYIYDLFLKYPHMKGVILLTLSAVNPKKAVYWLKIIKEIDPLFYTIKISKSSLVDDLCRKYDCLMNDLFHTIIFASEESSDDEKIEKRLKFIMKTKANTPDADELKLVYDERRRIIASGKLLPLQADQIFKALWDNNVKVGKTKQVKQKNVILRDPFKFFKCTYDSYDGSASFENGTEVKDFISILPYISIKYLDEVKKLFELLPIWNKKYKNVSECMYRFDKNQFFTGWEKLLREEAKYNPKEKDQFIFSPIGITKLKTGHTGGRQSKYYFAALEILDIMFNDNYTGIKPLLLELIEHPSPLVREKVKELLSK